MRKDYQRNHKRNTRYQRNQKPSNYICEPTCVLIGPFEIGFQLRGREVGALPLAGMLSSKANEEPERSQVFSQTAPKEITGAASTDCIYSYEPRLIHLVGILVVTSKASLPAVVRQSKGFHHHDLIQ